MDSDWINSAKPRVSGTILSTNSYNGKVVSILGKIVGAIDPSGKFLTLQTVDNQKIQIRFNQPLMEPLNGYLDIIGRVVNKSEIICYNYVNLSDDMMKIFDSDLFNRAVEVFDKNFQK